MLVPMSGAALGTERPTGRGGAPTTTSSTSPWRRGIAVIVVLLAVVPLSGCVGEPPSIDPSGVDELQIPTPAPDPDDFVVAVDNPWFPLEPGTVWTYRSIGSAAGAGPYGAPPDELTRTVTDRTPVVAGVPTVEVRDVLTDRLGRVLLERTHWYAQDAAGNVWAFGARTTSYGVSGAGAPPSWEAGVGGAEAGLMMPATPRLGDGYLQAFDPGVVEARARVVSLDQSAEVPAGAFDGLLWIEVTSGLDPGLVVRTYYAPGLGLVRSATAAGAAPGLELVDVTTP